MPIKPRNIARYPKNWPDISRTIRFDRAGGRCEECGAKNYRPHPDTGSKVVLTVAHLNHTPEDCRPENLRALCQRCHLHLDRHIHLTNRLRCQDTPDMFSGKIGSPHEWTDHAR
jgi:hypothetical protein